MPCAQGGVKYGSNSSNPQDLKRTMCLYSTPEAAYTVTNEAEALYLHALFALRETNLSHVQANFVPGVLAFFNCIQHNWCDLCRDIREGHSPPP